MCNYGLLLWLLEMIYFVMVQDLFDMFDVYQIECVIFIGYLMGGKVVMVFIVLVFECISGLVVIDIVLVDYYVCCYDEIFVVICVVSEFVVSICQQVVQVMCEYLQEEGVIQFLLKLFVDGDWCFNVLVLWDQYLYIVGWEIILVWLYLMQFIFGGNLFYVIDVYCDVLLVQFLQVWVYVIVGVGYWVYVEKFEVVLCVICCYLMSIVV